MGLHDFLKLAGAVLALLLFLPLIAETRRSGGAGQSFATWLLWAALDFILVGSLLQQHGNYYVMLGFALGDITLAALLLRQGRVAWGIFESVVLALVALCLGVWWGGGAWAATLASTAGVIIAGLPGLVKLWRAPDRKLSRIWAGYALANGLSFCGGTAMTVEERFAPGAFAAFSLAMMLAGLRKRS